MDKNDSDKDDLSRMVLFLSVCELLIWFCVEYYDSYQLFYVTLVHKNITKECTNSFRFLLSLSSVDVLFGHFVALDLWKNND